MANDGLDLARPPVQIWRAMSRHILYERTRGVDAYAMAAGGFNAVLAMPRTLGPRPRPPANPNSMTNAALLQLYSAHPGLMRRSLVRQATGIGSGQGVGS